MSNAFDRGAESLGNIVELGHVNLRVPDQRLATLFYVSGLGLTRDPYLMTGVDNMWANAGVSQFHLPTGAPQWLNGTTGLVVPDLAALLRRLAAVRGALEGTRFGFRETADGVEATCPWGNRMRLHAPDATRWGAVQLGMPYVQLDAPPGTLPGIARFYATVLGARVEQRADETRVQVARTAHLVFRETEAAAPSYDGHHVQVSVVDFGGLHATLLARGLVTREDDQHQYRFQDIVDPEDGRVLFTLEHEVRSMSHPMFGRVLVNRDATVTNRNYVPGREALPVRLAS